MDGSAEIERYWCHLCNREVTVDIDMLCAQCSSGVVQAIGNMSNVTNGSNVRVIHRPAGHDNNWVLRPFNSPRRSEWYKRQFVELVKCCIRTGQPNPGSRDSEFDTTSAAEAEEELNFHLDSLYNENLSDNSFENVNYHLSIDRQDIPQHRWELGQTSEEADSGDNEESDGNISIGGVDVEEYGVGVYLFGWRCFAIYGEQASSQIEEALQNIYNEESRLNSGEEENRGRRDIIKIDVHVVYCNCYTGYAELDILSNDLDWRTLLQGLEDNTIELNWAFFDHSKDEGDSDHDHEDVFDVGNPQDYVNDEEEYQRILQQWAENDDPNTRGPPPASKSAVDGLPTLVICEEQVQRGSALCAICKETVCVGELAKQMPCLHLFHGVCIISWLRFRNSCPICRFELHTDDEDYEEQKRKRTTLHSHQATGHMSTDEGDR